MPVYLYRREDGTTFEYKQKFLDDPLTTDPETGQKVVRVVQPTGVIFKGSGFYVNDSKNASKSNLKTSSTSTNKDNDTAASENGSSEKKTDTKAEAKTETKSDSKPKSDTKAS